MGESIGTTYLYRNSTIVEILKKTVERYITYLPVGNIAYGLLGRLTSEASLNQRKRPSDALKVT